MAPPPLPTTSLGLASTGDRYLSTVRTLDSLVAFYHQERMWVYRTRAALELAYLTDSDTPSPSAPISTISAPNSNSTPSEELQLQLPRLPAPDDREDSESDTPCGGVKEEQHSPSPPASTWARRKRGFKLELSGISARTKRAVRARGDIARRDAERVAEKADTRVAMLELFERMME
ncbi:hypothetical protein PLICRDRAFT_50063 [Plicaturopsis crispa FD-325 SS-3]|nr:hypothetical protein PLICRDRAFT_50063 [Plicaturopsis crispa FD-325 SS-3]